MAAQQQDLRLAVQSERDLRAACPVAVSSTVYFPRTKSTWKIERRVVIPPKLPISGFYALPRYWAPRLDVTGVEYLARCITDTGPGASMAIPTAAINELRALDQLRINHSRHAPHLIDARLARGEGNKQYITYILMRVPVGHRLGSTHEFAADRFWTLSQRHRVALRKLFNLALMYVHDSPLHMFYCALLIQIGRDIIRCGVYPMAFHPKDIIYNRNNQTVIITGFERSRTYAPIYRNLDLDNPQYSLYWEDGHLFNWGLINHPPKYVELFSRRPCDGTLFYALPKRHLKDADEASYPDPQRKTIEQRIVYQMRQGDSNIPLVASMSSLARSMSRHSLV
ncbi:hypothetical protein EJ06DRAFT_297529 [Trichodelitschia bisporula]|uniref:Uncharacterized protein n=1 Tax=Trichodelitschia bisporula TaxID=703511 RepID=A0A6G1I6P8_9PEZI|nr:hypothetical protein EJ06DRAFT_297529 [Trichodelitschia bisporula]